jgi:hypothetical protein
MYEQRQEGREDNFKCICKIPYGDHKHETPMSQSGLSSGKQEEKLVFFDIGKTHSAGHVIEH